MLDDGKDGRNENKMFRYADLFRMNQGKQRHTNL